MFYSTTLYAQDIITLRLMVLCFILSLSIPTLFLCEVWHLNILSHFCLALTLCVFMTFMIVTLRKCLHL